MFSCTATCITAHLTKFSPLAHKKIKLCTQDPESMYRTDYSLETTAPPCGSQCHILLTHDSDTESCFWSCLQTAGFVTVKCDGHSPRGGANQVKSADRYQSSTNNNNNSILWQFSFYRTLTNVEMNQKQQQLMELPNILSWNAGRSLRIEKLLQSQSKDGTLSKQHSGCRNWKGVSTFTLGSCISSSASGKRI